MTVRSGKRRGPLVVALALLALLAGATIPGLATAHAQPVTRAPALAASAQRPPQAVSYARIALVRVLTYYNGTVNSDPAPIPVPSACAADGVLIGTTGANLNSLNYVLVPTAAVNPITPCQGAQAAFQQLNGNAAGWSIGHIDVLLDVAYTGTDESQRGSVKYIIDPSQITTNGGPHAPALLALALTTPAGAPVHDLPVLTTPQPSDAPADAAQYVLDLTSFAGQPLASDAVTAGEVRTTLYPIALAADLLSVPGTSPGVGGGTSSAGKPTPTAPTVPTSLSGELSLGAPVVDSNGRLVGVLVPDARGNHVVAPLDEVIRRIGPVTGRSGPLMDQWHQALDDFYAAPPRYAQAAAAFAALAHTYPDFAGVAPYQAAAQQQSPAIPSLTKAAATPAVVTATGSAVNPLLAAALVGLILLLLILLLTLWLLRRRKERRSLTGPAILSPAAETMLDLLPRDAPLDSLVEAPTQPLPTVAAPSGGGIENLATLHLPAVPPPARQRPRLPVMSHAAGLTNPGIKRAGDPNQDNVLALRGVRSVEGRIQPYGLFIVADGMGGHLNGQEASRLAIELVTTAVLHVLTSGQTLTESALVALLRESVARASTELQRRNMEERADMGTTITAALIADDMAYIANVGDSRTYLMSPETGLRQITTDHSVVASLVAAGVIRPDDVYTHPRRNQIYRSLGGEHGDAEVDTFEVPLQAGDKLLLCSDGLWEMVRDPQIERILRGTADPQQAVELLIREANANGGEDNISAVVIRLLEDVPRDVEPGMEVLVAPQTASISSGL
jgi:serine/threonine protein phosphatase PrpC